MPRKLDHIGHIVRDLEEGMKLYERFGLTPVTDIRESPRWGSRVIFYPFFNGINMELIQPGGLGNDFAYRCMQMRGEGVFHLSYRTDDFDAEVREWMEKGFSVETVEGQSAEHKIRLAFLAPEETEGLWLEFIGRE
jgi:methylmalonyl-CoA/ethylmalonyl-CoA epimerase